MKVAIVGTGISGLVCAHLLHPHHEIAVFEANDYVGGHTNTVDVTLEGRDYAIDTGFIVYNERNYPNFVRLLDQLGVATQPSSMTFSVRNERTGVEWRGSNLNTMFAQRRNLLRPSFHRMLIDILRFNKAAKRLVDDDRLGRADESVSLAEFVSTLRLSPRFTEEFLIPFGASIWSADPSTFLDFPATTYTRFMANHGLLDLRGMPQWRTVAGGSQRYVEKLIPPFADRIRLRTPVAKVVRTAVGVEIVTADGPERFDKVILAGHSDQSLRLLADADPAEREILGAIRYQPNTATLHTDTAFLPVNPRARASWNYHVGAGDQREAALTYWMNELQSIDSPHEFMVTLNQADRIDRSKVLAEFEYDHPVYDAEAIRAQGRRPEIQGVNGTFFAGAYWGYGFHEDGVRSALDVCRHFGVGLDGPILDDAPTVTIDAADTGDDEGDVVGDGRLVRA